MQTPQTTPRKQLLLTLSVACQICMGKVKDPVICCNRHAFCSLCLLNWLKHRKECPACRVPMVEGLPILAGDLDKVPISTAPSPDEQSRSLALKRTRFDSIIDEYEQDIRLYRDEIAQLKESLKELQQRHDLLLAERQVNHSASNLDMVPINEKPSLSFHIEEDAGLNPFLEQTTSVVDTSTRISTAGSNLELQQLILFLQHENQQLKQELLLAQQRSTTSASSNTGNTGNTGRTMLPITPSKNSIASNAFKQRIAELERENASLNAALLKSDEYIEQLLLQRRE
ncbi:hypothetical protein BCR33DRAFT_763496 [Rhizoclosmatium globosum]|uniref:RING-type domain-containing protein n=1 Tax=Rhizoclosmatium globosum TaxID=329046 RepID=A0A1Y2CPT8_9FUNG|nr:hypothetical protein BCR33DRAFT_763496 [Rhizoclosmatium globosum]|eukprot:ORY49041.1 hypothetical protein BCR33DRAFT_763496 [Rhizoclosmatium globosum]